MEACENWVTKLIDSNLVEMQVNEKTGYITIAKANPSM